MTRDHVRVTFDQLIERMAYPTDTAKVMEFVREHGNSDDVVNMAQQLQPQTFKSPNEIRRALDGSDA